MYCLVSVNVLLPELAKPEPAVTPEVTPEVVPDDPNEGLARGRRRSTRSKKPGAAGTLLEGGGVLYD